MGKAALVTGASRRIGRSIALALAGDGYDVALHYRTESGDVAETRERIERAGRRCATLRADLTEPTGRRELIEAAFDAFDELCVLVNNASIFEPGSFDETDEALFDRQFDVNFKAPFFLTQRFARRAESGCVVNLLDVRIARTPETYFAYTLSKKALAAFTEMAAVALAPAVRVCGVCPGLILPSVGSRPGLFEELVPRVPLQRRGRPEQVAEAVRSLIRQDYLTGQILYVDGGEHLPE